MMLESMNNRSRYISILPTGELKPALVSTGDAHSRFGVSLIVSRRMPAPVLAAFGGICGSTGTAGRTGGGTCIGSSGGT